MAHQIAIAKASFSAGFLRSDPTPVSRDEIARFHTLLETALARCSPSNIQACKAWLLTNAIPSSARITALGKYLAALSAALGTATEEGSGAGVGTSVRRKRLHVLYVLNDLLHHTKYHTTPSTAHTSLASNLQPHLVALVESAASCDQDKHPKLHKRLGEILDIWQDNGYYAAGYVSKLRETVENASRQGSSGAANVGFENGASEGTVGRSAAKNAPFVMPATHGDASVAWYDLPAGNLMPHIVPNSTQPINPQMVMPLRFVAGPADEGLANVVRDFLGDVERMYDPTNTLDEGISMDIDELGQPLVKDEITGEWTVKETYYGWSKEFCERMKRRQNGILPKDEPRGRRRSDSGVRSRSRSRSRDSRGSRSVTPRKRRKYSTSVSRSRSPNGRRHNSRSRSVSRTRSTRGRYQSRDSGSRSRSRLRPSSRSRSLRRGHRRSRSYSRSRTRSRTPKRSPRRKSPFMAKQPPAPAQQYQPQHAQAPPARQPANFTPPMSFPIPPPPIVGNAFPLGPGGLPIPPPPPPNHTGVWPPPPPPLSAAMGQNSPVPPPFPPFNVPNMAGLMPPSFSPPQAGFSGQGTNGMPYQQPSPYQFPNPMQGQPQMQQGNFGNHAGGYSASPRGGWSQGNGYGYGNRGRGR